MSTTLIWFSLVIIFLLLEASTVTLYGFVLAGGCLVAGIIAYFTGGDFHWIQIVACLIVVSIGSLLVPRFFKHTGKHLPTGLDAYMGMKTIIKIVDNKPKVTLDGVDYLVHCEHKLTDGQKVEINGRDGTILIVQ